MKITNYLKKSAIILTAVTVLSIAVLGGVASARTEYNPDGTPTITTPIFNEFFNVPFGVGDEADFVRIKPKAGTNADYVDILNAACDNGDLFTVRTYIHNGADPSQNENGNGSAVAHDVIVRMRAPLNTKNKLFVFDSTVSASNAASVSDSARLSCGDKTVKLTLVPSSVQTYSKPIGYNSAPDSAVNGELKIGSRVNGSGDVWGCWEDRVTVMYDVKVEDVVTPPVTPPTPKPETPVTVKELPNTGSGDLVAIFVATTFAGMVAYRVVLARKNQ